MKLPDDSQPFVALDFETADSGRDSACAVGLVRVEGGRIVRRESHLIRPPRSIFQFTYIHGITWRMVSQEPTFRELWPKIRPMFAEAEFFAAHNASFDRSVLEACCRGAGVPAPTLPFLCTMRLARRTWGIRPTRLPDVCGYLGLSLTHHDALSDAEACAQIAIAARERAVRFSCEEEDAG